MTSRFTMFCTLCGRNPLKSRRVTPRLLKKLGYFQQQSQKYELTLRLEMCFIRKYKSMTVLSLETYFYMKYMCCGILKVSFLLILHINPFIRLLKAILPSFFHEQESMFTTLMYGPSPILFASGILQFFTACTVKAVMLSL